MDTKLQEYNGKDIYYVEENGRDYYIQNINDFSDDEISIIDSYNSSRNNAIFENNTKYDYTSFLWSHIEWEHIEMDLTDMGKKCLIELEDVELLNMADSYGYND